MCDLVCLSKLTDGFRKINGEVPPGELLPLEGSTTLLNVVNNDCKRVFISKGTRKAGTRVGIHVHRYGGYTLVLSGAITDFVQGQPNKTYTAPSGYYMPPCTPMSAANLGDTDAELIDIFIGEPNTPFIEVLEPQWNHPRFGMFDKNTGPCGNPNLCKSKSKIPSFSSGRTRVPGILTGSYKIFSSQVKTDFLFSYAPRYIRKG